MSKTQTKKKPLRGPGGRFLSKAEIAALEATKQAEREARRAAKGKAPAAPRVPRLIEVAGRKHRKASKYTQAVALIQDNAGKTRSESLALLESTLGLKNSTAQNWLRQIRKELNLPAYDRKETPAVTETPAQ